MMPTALFYIVLLCMFFYVTTFSILKYKRVDVSISLIYGIVEY